MAEAKALRPRLPRRTVPIEAARGGSGGGAGARSGVERAVAMLDLLVLLAIGAAGLAFAFFQTRHMHGYTYAQWTGPWNDYDEGVYITSAWQLNHGHAMFSQVFSSQPALFLTGLAVTLRIAGSDAGHLYPTICGLPAAVAAAWLAWEVSGRWSALVASAALLLSPGFVIAAHAVEAEAPMMAFGGMAVAASARYARGGRRRWLAAASLLLAAATLSKLLGVALALPLAAAMALKWWDHDRPALDRRIVLDIAMAAVCFLLPIALVFGVLAPGDQWDQVVRFHLKASEVSASTAGNGATFRQFLGWDPGLVALAVVGAAVTAVLRRRLMLIPAAWLLANLATLIRYHPLFVHHLTVLLPAMAVLAGGLATLETAPSVGFLRKASIACLIACGALAYLIWLPNVLDHSHHALVANSTDANMQLKTREAGWLASHSGPGDTVVVDDQVIAVLANRLVPPALTDTSTVRCLSGYLPLETLVQATQASHVKAVLLTRALKDNAACTSYLGWLQAHYKPLKLPGNIWHAVGFVAP